MAMSKAEPSIKPATKEVVAERLLAWARIIFLILAAGIFLVPPWTFGGMGPEGYFWIVWTGRLCTVPLGLWLVSRVLRGRGPRASFWVALICWGLLGVQIWLSLGNRSHVPQAPWVGEQFIPMVHDEHWPSTAFSGATRTQAQLWLAFGLLALTARAVGLRSRQFRALLWMFVINATILAVIGVPFKYSGEKKILGTWDVPEWYFYSTFLYHNHWCAFALLAMAAALALVVAYRARWIRVGLFTAIVFLAASAPFSISRLGTLSMLLFGGAALWLAARWRKTDLRPAASAQTKLTFFVGIMAGAAIVGGGVFYLLSTHRQAGGHRAWSGLLSQNPLGVRQFLFEDTIPMIADKPWFGWGLGAYGAGFQAYQRLETRGGLQGARLTLYEHAHNDWLERLAELGTIGFALFIFPGIAWIYSRLMRKIPMLGPERWILTGCIAVLIFALGDMAFANRTVAAAFAILFPLSLHSRNSVKISGETPSNRTCNLS